MLPFSLRRFSAAFGAALAFVCLPATPAAVAEPDADAALLARIDEIRSRGGPHSPELLEPLTSLGVLYRESREPVLALASLEEALQILRINRGLYTLEQVPLLKQIIRLEDERGNAKGAWDREQVLLALLRRHPTALETVPVLHELADARMAVLREFLNNERPPEVLLGCFYEEWPGIEGGNCRAGSRKTVVQGMFAEAQRTYADAIAVLLYHGLYGSPELRELELDLLRGVDLLRSLYGDGRSGAPLVPAHLAASSIEPWRSRIAPIAALEEWHAQAAVDRLPLEAESRNAAAKHVRLMSTYHRGRQSLRRLYEYASASDEPLLEQAEAIVQLADWDLLYSRNGRAVDTYASVYAMLAGDDGASATIERLFAPSTPVVLPAFQPNPLVNDDPRPATGHVDVAFEITRYGRSRAIAVRDATNASADAVARLVEVINRSRFRPRLTDGEFAAATPVLLRYYLYD
jgi:hypothetical protein